MKRWIGLCLLACACGGSNGGNGGPDSGTPHGSGSFTGTVNGHSLTVKDAVFGDPSSSLDAIIVSDQENLCTLLAGTTFPGGTVTVLGIAIVNTNTSPAGPVVAGTYDWANLQGGGSLPTGLIWDGAFALPTDCNGGGQAWSPNAGTVTVTQMGNTTGKTLKATYTNLTFDGATGGLSGTIEATFCAAATVAPSCGRQLVARPPSVE
jgi:hypothetical protein